MPAKTRRVWTDHVTFWTDHVTPTPWGVKLYSYNMAEKAGVRRSKIPRYTRTTTPILSTSYRKVLQEIKSKRAEIEVKQRKIDNLKKTLPVEKEHDTLLSASCSNIQSTQEEEKLTQASPSGLIGSKIRSTIFSPGGTKRKGTYNTNTLLRR